MMTITDLDEKLQKALNEFSEEMRASYEEADCTAATKDDIHNLARQSFYTMNTFRKEIINYLKQQP